MLSLFSKRRYRDCDGSTRRDFLKVGSLGAGALTLPHLLRARAEAATAGKTTKNTSVIWLFLQGGPTHVETFDPKMTAPVEYRSTTGEVSTPIPGVTVGGTLPQIASVVDRMALVRSFAHKNSSHGGGTHWVMTGYDNRTIDNGGVPARPSLGSITSRYRGPNNLETGIPTYIRLNSIRADGAAFLGTACDPFQSGGEAVKAMELAITNSRLGDRRNLLKQIDTLNRATDARGMMDGLDSFEQQAFNAILGDARLAFDIQQEDKRTLDRYGRGLGESLLRARRLCDAGCGFVTISTGGWDMHGSVANSMKSRSPQIDQAISALVEDIYQRGQQDDILLVVTGEFGRTPKINSKGGRDHWAPLSTLALSGGGLKMGQTVGQSAPKVDVPDSDPIGPQDLMATVFHVLGIDRNVQYYTNAGRPVSMIDNGKPIVELL